MILCVGWGYLLPTSPILMIVVFLPAVERRVFFSSILSCFVVVPPLGLTIGRSIVFFLFFFFLDSEFVPACC